MGGSVAYDHTVPETPKKKKKSKAVPVPAPPPPPPFVEVRKALFRNAFVGTMNGIEFSNTNIRVHSRRNAACKPSTPRLLSANSNILKAASPVLQTIIDSNTNADTSGDYDCDSDLEDEPSEPVFPSDDDTTFNDAVDAPRPAEEASFGSATTASHEASLDVHSLAEDLSSKAVLSDADEDYAFAEAGHSVDGEEAHRLALERDMEEELEREEAARAEACGVAFEDGIQSTSVTEEASVPASNPDERDDVTLPIQGGAFRTWQALVLYLYTDHIKFSSLKSDYFSFGNISSGEQEWPCSPKSMYRLADQLQLDELKQTAKRAIESELSDTNIVAELFSDFTWRYPEILKMETEVYYRYRTSMRVVRDMSDVLKRMQKGELPHSAMVMDSLLLKLCTS